MGEKLIKNLIEDCIDGYEDYEIREFFGDRFIEKRKIRNLQEIKMEALISRIYPLKNTPAKVLDLGCGISPFSIYLSKAGYDVTCTDKYEIFLEKTEEIAKKYEVENIYFVRREFDNLGFKKEFDVIFSSDSLVSKLGLLPIFESGSKKEKEHAITKQKELIVSMIEEGKSRDDFVDYERGINVCVPYSLKAFEEAREALVDDGYLFLGVSCSNPHCSLMDENFKLLNMAGFEKYSEEKYVRKMFRYAVFKKSPQVSSA
ncbi:MAG: class I SAM-dependent methyltransferase [archaeon]|nr:MAG: class I SAM-dependent methyltransferase [archaeon]